MQVSWLPRRRGRATDLGDIRRGELQRRLAQSVFATIQRCGLHILKRIASVLQNARFTLQKRGFCASGARKTAKNRCNLCTRTVPWARPCISESPAVTFIRDAPITGWPNAMCLPPLMAALDLRPRSPSSHISLSSSYPACSAPSMRDLRR
jgi:hypothetical protein